MNQGIIIAFMIIAMSSHSKAQQALKLDYCSKVPGAFKDCGALYTYDSVPLGKKKIYTAYRLPEPGYNNSCREAGKPAINGNQNH